MVLTEVITSIMIRRPRHGVFAQAPLKSLNVEAAVLNLKFGNFFQEN